MGVIEFVDGYYCSRCFRHLHECKGGESCIPPSTESDILWAVVLQTMQEASEKEDRDINNRLFTYNQQTIKRAFNSVKKFHEDSWRRWQKESHERGAGVRHNDC